MKYLQLILFSLLISSCSSTKRVAETPKKETPVVVKNKDSIIKKTKFVETTSETTEILENTISTISETVVKEKAIETFNHYSWNSLLQKHVTNQGNVNYKGFKTDRKLLLNYIESLSETIPNESWTKEDKLAYWINVYNAFTIDLILRNYPIKSIKDIKNPWEQRLWKLGNKWYNLNEIEHQILRKMDEPRIHFAIVCASYSCPKLRNEAYQASNLDEQLTNASKEFLSDSNRNEISENNLKLSKIFQWFSKDFKQDGDLIDFLNKYSDVSISAKAKKNFKDYNWNLNE